MKRRFENRHVLLGVTGSIAAYKACQVLRMLQREGAEVRVAMTKAAQQFVGPLSFETLSGQEVITDLFPSHRVVKARHIHIAEWADCILICPATANIIGKVASGIADDFLTTAVMAARSPVIFVPAMDDRMVHNPIYLSNCEKLVTLGYQFVSPEEGALASGAEGAGRLADYPRIMNSVKSALLGSDRLKGVKLLVTAGPTREFLDPVRYLSNQSSGKMGYALAEEAVLRHAEVTLVSGPTDLVPFEGIRVKKVQTAEEMARVVKEEWKRHQVLIMAAAVADFRPVKKSDQKIKKGPSKWTLELEQTEDILSAIAQSKKKGIVVGFALETEAGEVRAAQKLVDKQLDFICLNNPLEKGSGFGEDTNKVTLIDREKKVESYPVMEKWEVAGKILDRVGKLLGRK